MRILDSSCSGSSLSAALLILVELCGWINAATLTKRSLNADILYYEELDYDTSHLLTEHHRIARRSAASPPGSIKWKFSSHGRDFTLQISPDPDIFTKDFVVETENGVVDFDKSRAYVGHIVGKAGSQVSGILLKDGRFEGKMLDGSEEFFIERAEKYIPKEESFDRNSKSVFHSVIYKLSDVDLKALQNTTDCKSDELRESMNDIMRSIHIDQDVYESLDDADGPEDSPYRQHNMYNPIRHRVRRAAIDPVKTMCELYIQADHLYYQKWGSSVDTVIEQITAHVEAVNDIYKITDFDDDGSGDNIRFVVKKLKIWTDPTASGYPFSSSNLGVKKYLELFSGQDNFNSFCLAYTFTHRDFNDGTLGLAWTASLDSSGGVCTRNGLYNGVSMSLNSGIVTTLNFQRDVVFAISQITFAHELGHNLGSQHDDESSSNCSPGDPDGNYIMFPKATDGDKPNNNKFSPCSISSMNTVMNAKARNVETSACFKAYSSTVCGNKIVEDGEECDCGWADECEETCCNPQKETYDVLTYTPCTYTAGAACSPSEGACCDSSCAVRQVSDNFQCRAATQCKLEAVCDGTGTCPASINEADAVDCNDGMVCYNGECSNAICQAFGYTTCQCSPIEADNWADERLCSLCCEDGGVCKPASEISSITKTADGVAGQPCFDYQGYCDVFLKCRKLDPVGILNGLKKALFSEEGLANMSEWMKANWYIVAASAVGFVILLALVVRFCAKHEPVIPPESSNKVHPTKSPPPSYSDSQRKRRTQTTGHY